MEARCIWFVVWTNNRFVEEWYQVAQFRSFAAARRYAEKVLDKFPSMLPGFKFEKVEYFNGSIVKSEFIA